MNAVNGTASFSIPIPVSPARGVSPNLSLSYNSGGGNGIFGLGWALSLSSIKRSTGKELPQYFDGVDSDTFLFSEAEDLVPEYKKENDGSFSLDAENNYVINEKDSPDGSFTIRFYKPRIEGLFARIERWLHKTSGEIKWRVITKENATTLFGWSKDSRIANPKDEKRIFQWLPEFVFDDKGNCARYIYKKEDKAGFDSSLLHNRNRLEAADITYVNLYPEKVLYGNKTPYKKFGDAFPAETDFMFQTIFDFGEYNPNSPYDKIKNWDFRKDAFSEYKSGFEIRTTRLCKRVLLYHFFDELPGDTALVKSLDFEYDTAAEEDFTFLKSVTSCGYIKQTNGTYTSKKLPPTEFEYQKHDWNKEVKTVSGENLVNAPSGLDERSYQFTDLFNEGLSGILTEQAAGWYYKHNLGDGKFERAKLVSPKPSFLGLGNGLQLLDLDGDGSKQIVNYNTEPKGFFELNDENEWLPFRNFENLPNINFQDSNTRLLDLTGDGMPDVLVTEDNVFTWYESSGRNGFSRASKTAKSFDEEAGPHVVFADSTQSIFLADMSGDGLTDIVRIRNGEICYWSNLGYGKFGTKVNMDNAPTFDHPESFNPALIRLADIDGSGSGDIVYLGKNKFSCWLNLSGNAFSSVPFEIEAFPEIHNQSSITVTDLLGNGVACIVWSSDLAKDAAASLKYIDLMNGKKPHIMVGYKNNLGKEVSLEYTPSTRLYIEDKLAGKPWITKLHFPVHCISRTETRDTISGFRFASSYKYHHGYYDHAEREFRGFGRVEQTDSEHFEHWIKGDASNIVEQTLHQEPVITKSWFHTGAFLSRGKILSQFAKEYWYEEMNRQDFAVAHNETALPDARLITAPGLDPALIAKLSAQEWREALRACKSMGLRSEVFAEDAPLVGATPDQLRKQLSPFTVTAHNCVIELVQPKGRNKHAVFVVKESESVTYSYERKTDDPRIAHNLNIKLDEYGKVLESAAVVYPRALPDVTLSPETRAAQNKTFITYAQNKFTNDIKTSDAYRLRQPSETKTYELKGVAKADTLFTVSDFEDILIDSVEVEYHQVDTNPAAGASQKRLIEHTRTVFYRDDLTGALPLHDLETKGLSFESYQLAYTPALLSDIFGTKLTNAQILALMPEGKFMHSEADDNWWIRSGTTQYIEGAETVADAENRFRMPISYTDPYGAKTKIKYFSDYFLFIEEIQDPLQNKTKVLSFNMRTLSAQRMQDANDNISEAIADELGFIKAVAVFGKGAEADDLASINEFMSAAESSLVGSFFNAAASDQLVTFGKNLLHHATTRFVYDLDVYKNSGGTKPAVAASIIREEHFQKNNNSPVQISFEYSNGFGQVMMKKTQAEPGIAKQVTVNPDDTYSVSETDTAASHPKQLRWIGNGRKVLNNKGKPVKQYEPYFSVTHQYEDLKELVETGVTPILYYDVAGRMIKTEFPERTFSKTEFDSWKQVIYDQNDTVLETDWFNKRFNRLIDAELTAAGKDPKREKLAAGKAAKHAATPLTQHFDTLGRLVLQVEHNKDAAADVFYHTRADLDLEGNLRRVTDGRDNPVMRYKYDMLGNLVYQNSMDAGQRWLIQNIVGNPLRSWDERNQELSFEYDILHRPVVKKVTGGDGAVPLNNVYEKIIYGEAFPNPETSNFRARAVIIYDTSGKSEISAFDFKGSPLGSAKTFAENYKDVADWSGANPDARLELETFVSSFEYDALKRITRQTAPDNSIFLPAYNEAGLLDRVQVTQNGNTEFFVKNIDYDEKGQRRRIRYGNDVTTNYFYDKETFRLVHLETKRQTGDPFQDLYYTFDPVGNITHIEDKNIPDVFFDNQKIEGVASYTYDAVYRLTEATGREHIGQAIFGQFDNWNDLPFMKQYSRNDALAWRNYTQQYDYDKAGNITEMRHTTGAAAGNWTRIYNYAAGNNRLLSTKVGADTYNYPHHPEHGFITALPHLQVMKWNFKEELQAVAKQSVLNGTPETTWYVYDGGGQRTRKITENEAAAGVEPTKKSERIYVGGVEIYREYGIAGAVALERKSYHVMDDKKRIAMIETRTAGDDDAPLRLVRYQFGNHLGSASLETDADARVISYEEYHPFGTTSYQAVDKDIKAAAKRYRYTGMERDEESGLSYHSARYYLPWLGRWLNADPVGLKGGINFYAYVKNNPVMALDPSGTDGETCGVWDEEATTCYAEPCPTEARPDTPAPTALPPPPPRVRVRPRPTPQAASATQETHTQPWELGPRGERIPINGYRGPLRERYTKPYAIMYAEQGNYEAAELAENYMCPTCHVFSQVSPSNFNLRGYVNSWQQGYITGFVEIPLKANPIGGAWEIGVSGGQAITGESSGLHISNIVHGNFDTGRQLSTRERLWEGGSFVVGAATLGVGLRAQGAAPTGAFSQGAAGGGAGLGRLATAELQVSERGLEIVEQHLARFGSVPQNEAMIARLREALSQGRRISGADASFYMHEVNEATLMGRGMVYDTAHAAALSKYQVSPFSVYHPEVIQAFPGEFNQNWFRFWGISQ
ncbi:MAG TPA: SpvB/TcaC N-terminal domain-containing protein [Pyrinomonadaceae bacterium]